MPLETAGRLAYKAVTDAGFDMSPQTFNANVRNAMATGRLPEGQIVFGGKSTDRGCAIAIPARSPGKPTPAKDAAYRERVREFSREIMKIRSRLEFAPSTRGWCYILEELGLRKGDFTIAERAITLCRKSGDLPLDIVSEDATRETIGLIDIDDDPPREYADRILSTSKYYIDHYEPIDFWVQQKTYVEMVVEKIDLKNLFAPVCTKHFVPLTNMKGWADLNSRARIMKRMQAREAKGQRCVLLVCTDLDPGGLLIAEQLRQNLADLTPATGWSPENLIIERFGLTGEFVRKHRLAWIENLETGSGENLADPKHRDYGKPHVQEYIAKYGERKCEANALIVRPEAGRRLCRDAIRRYVRNSDLDRHSAALAAARKNLRREFPAALRRFAKEFRG
jgi:hypothetical protein